jgi:cysteine-rich repeat protein
MDRVTKTMGLLACLAVAACGGGGAQKGVTCPTGQHDGGDGVCVAVGVCSAGYHDGGGGICLPDLPCASGYHDGGGGVCVPSGTCSTGYHDGGGGRCTATGTCASGYVLTSSGTCAKSAACATGTHDNGAGVCVPDTTCPAGYHEGGTGTCVPVGACSAGYHDGGSGDCVLDGNCSAGFHDGGDRTCVPLVACSAGYHDGGGGDCVADGECSWGYHDGGDGRCLPPDQCSAGYHDGGDGTCLYAGLCVRGYSLDSTGLCVPAPAGTGGAGGGVTLTIRPDAGPGTGGVTGTGGGVGSGGTVGAGGVPRDGGMGGGGAGGTTVVIPAVCGNGKKEGSEGCDDGNTAGSDGCTFDCKVEVGYVCPVPGQPCVEALGCGNGIVTADETCDDGNTKSGDGCSADCLTIEDGWECRVPGQRCTPECGDSKLIGYENCDDGNANSGDGCSSTCQVEPGYDCFEIGKACTRSECGNGKRERNELCDCGDDPNNLPSGCQAPNGFFYGDGKGCSTMCTPEPICLDASGKTQACTTTCGDGNVDPGEDCDDGNMTDSDGCSSACKVENGFTCAISTYQVSSTCQSGSGQCLELPVVYRDFLPENMASGGHPDFPFLGTRYGGSTKPTTICVPNAAGPSKGNDSTARCWGIVGDSLQGGKPQPGPTKTCACQFSDWSIGNTSRIPGGYTLAGNDSPLSDGNAGIQGGDPGTTVNTISTGGAYNGTLTGYTQSNPGGPIWKGTVPTYKDASSLKQWWNDDGSVNKTFASILELPAIGSNIYQYASKVHLAQGGFFPLDTLNPSQVTLCDLFPYWNRGNGQPIWTTCTGDQYLFVPRVTASDCVSGDSVDDGCWVTSVPGQKHDFYFTSEARYYFVYDGSNGLVLQFYGDDDLFIFVNGVLVLDLGSVHQQLPGKVTITGSPGDARVLEGGCLDTAGNLVGASAGSTACSPGNANPKLGAASPDDFRDRTVKLGLQTGKVYELAIFGADRHPPESNFQLTLQGFTTKRSSCVPRCGDGVVTGNEECDCGDGSGTVPASCPGPNSDATYGGCTGTCRFGPYCGDGMVNGPEECDNGKDNGAAYGEAGCTAGCTRPHFCGDGILDAYAGEQCDLGTSNGMSVCNIECHTLPI